MKCKAFVRIFLPIYIFKYFLLYLMQVKPSVGFYPLVSNENIQILIIIIIIICLVMIILS